jgi:uncharacterized protein
MPTYPTPLEQFRSFCFQNKASDLENAIEYFAVFGGMGWNVDMSKPLDELIKEKIFVNYRYIHADITKITQNNRAHQSLLTALAVGDRRERSAFKRANLPRKEGQESSSFLVENGLLVRSRSQEEPADIDEEVSDRLTFTAPFMRFWFSFVSPYYKGIKDGDFVEANERWEATKQAFFDFTYEALAVELVKKSFTDDAIEKIGSYWDNNDEIEILAQTKSGKVVAGSCKYSKSKTNKSALTRLQESCERAKLSPDVFVIFSKNGFSSEFKKEKGGNLRLLALKNLKILIENLNEKDLIISAGKKY